VIIRLHHDLLSAIIGREVLDKLIRLYPSKYEELEPLMDYVPEWMREYSSEGSAVMVVTREEFDELIPELAEYVDVLRA
jgi:hypothetical protein